tara:strand:+ start:60 stop:302 length:243 start_codon:yes stop_codon:yes gene_type:complete
MNRKYIKENKKLVKEFIGALVKAVVQKKADRFIRKLSKDPDNKKSFDKIRNLTKDIEIKLNNLEKTNPEFVKDFRKKYGY